MSTQLGKPNALRNLFCSVLTLVAYSSLAIAETPSFSTMFSEASRDGSCNVEIVQKQDATFFVPSSGNARDRFHTLVWGSGTGEKPLSYEVLLKSIASHCIFVAAANTGSAGSGREMAEAYEQAMDLFSDSLVPGGYVCTAGHSQGGGGSYNAANILEADCVISVQADTRFTTRIREPLEAETEVIALWSSSDWLAPKNGNLRNIQSNSQILASVESQSETHRAPLEGRAGHIGTLFRLAALAQLSSDSRRSQRYRRAFWGGTSASTVTEAAREVSDVFRDDGAQRVAP